MFAALFGHLLPQAAGMLEGSTPRLVWRQGKGRACAFSPVSPKDIQDPSNAQFSLFLEADS